MKTEDTRLAQEMTTLSKAYTKNKETLIAELGKSPIAQATLSMVTLALLVGPPQPLASNWNGT